MLLAVGISCILVSMSWAIVDYMKEIVSFGYSSSCNLLMRREVELKKIAVCEQHLDVSFC